MCEKKDFLLFRVGTDEKRVLEIKIMIRKNFSLFSKIIKNQKEKEFFSEAIIKYLQRS